jgi:tetratricopeptide (TPR) repeat protein
MESHQNLK